MTPELAPLLLESILGSFVILIEALRTAFLANPLPFIAIALIFVLSALLPATSRRRRRRYS